MSARSGTETRKRRTQIGVRLNPSETAWLDELAQQWRTSRPEALRRVLERYVLAAVKP